MVSKNLIIAVLAAMLGATALLMLFFLIADFDSLLGRKHLAMKVGQTRITIEELSIIKQSSGVNSRTMADHAFAADFFETLLQAEAGRKNALDRKPDFLQKIADFDMALKNRGREEIIIKAAFLLEQLAASFRQTVIENYDYSDELAKTSLPEVNVQPRLHLRTILVEDEQAAAEVIKERIAGVSFDQLNASFSRSLYAAVGGDIGWKTANDFPPDVFQGLMLLEPGILAEAFSDEAGTHLYEVVSRPAQNLERATRAAKELALRKLKQQRLRQRLVRLRNEIDFWVNPTLQMRCQIVPNAARAH